MIARALRVNLNELPADVRARLKADVPGVSVKRTAAQRALERARADAKRESFYTALLLWKLPRPVAEHRFHETRDWRFDYAWVAQRVALEVDGGAFASGRHTRGAGFRRDLEKRNAAVVAGWRVLHVLPEQLTTSVTRALLAEVLR